MKRISAILLIISLLLAPSMFSSCSSDEGSEDFYFTISWGANGDSFYSSKTGTLRRSRDYSEKSSEYSTTMFFSEDDMKIIYDLIAEIDVDSLPSQYKGPESKPSIKLTLYVYEGGSSKTVTGYNMSDYLENSNNEKAQLFYDNCMEIIEMITATEEWKSLPYHFYM